MKHGLFFGLVAALLALPVVLAQSGSDSFTKQGKLGAAYMLVFDPTRIETVEGTIVRIHQAPNTKVWLTSVNLLLRTKLGEIKVELGPSWFIDNQELHLAVDDRVSVTGSRVRPNGVDTIVAAEVRRGDEILGLRAADGTPVWVAWRWRSSEGGVR